MRKKKLNQKLNNTTSIKVKNEAKEAIKSLDKSIAHPRRERCKYKGEMIQMDASSFMWVPNETWHLHVAIDDASGELAGAYFDHQETLKGYYNVFFEILTGYGIPYMFYTDRRTIFEYKRKARAMDHDDTFTQFAYACHQLGTEIKTTSVAQAKGRVERVNQTLQSRLPVELRRARITNIEAANEFLKSYLKKFNDQFALQINDSKCVYEKQPSIERINTILAVISERKIDSGHSIKYKNNFYFPINKNGVYEYFRVKTNALVIESFDGNLFVNINDQLYSLKKIETHKKHSENIDPEYEEPKVKKKKVYIPPMTHPWKQQSYLNFLEKQKHHVRC